MATEQTIKRQKILGIAAIALGGIAILLGMWDAFVEQDGGGMQSFLRTLIPGAVVESMGVIALLQAQKKEKELKE